MDLVIRNARLSDRAGDEPLDIGIDKGRIVAIERGLKAEAKEYDAKGMLACPGLIETHIHIDKSRIIDRCAPQEREHLSPVKGVTPLTCWPEPRPAVPSVALSGLALSQAIISLKSFAGKSLRATAT